jgi:hypothetical protein
VTVLVQGRMGRRVFGRGRVLRNGDFRIARRLRPRGRTVSVVAMVRGVGRSHRVRLAVRR